MKNVYCLGLALAVMSTSAWAKKEEVYCAAVATQVQVQGGKSKALPIAETVVGAAAVGATFVRLVDDPKWENVAWYALSSAILFHGVSQLTKGKPDPKIATAMRVAVSDASEEGLEWCNPEVGLMPVAPSEKEMTLRPFKGRNDLYEVVKFKTIRQDGTKEEFHIENGTIESDKTILYPSMRKLAIIKVTE